mmetsp:Transcript_87358/g.247675  ORF Transcript_87358/g.247675 Transcript_87358/m.247675 type:complete len:241 (-) Transcript_87358:851-1573(-)
MDCAVHPPRPQGLRGGPALLRLDLEHAGDGDAEAILDEGGQRRTGSRAEELEVPDFALVAGRRAGYPLQELLHAERPAGELVEVHRQAPRVREEAVVAPAVDEGLQDLGGAEGQRAAGVPQQLPRPDHEHRQAEVRELQARAVVGQDDVRGLQVPVAHPVPVEVHHRAELLLHEAHDHALGQAPLVLLPELQVVLVQGPHPAEAHDQVEVRLPVHGPARVHDVGVGRQVAHEIELAVQRE